MPVIYTSIFIPLPIAVGKSADRLSSVSGKTKPKRAEKKEATELNAILVDGREVRLEYDEERTDRFGRTLAYVYVKIWDVEVFVNEYLVKVGYAKLATFPPNVKYMDRFVAAEKVARERKLGVWGQNK